MDFEYDQDFHFPVDSDIFLSLTGSIRIVDAHGKAVAIKVTDDASVLIDPVLGACGILPDGTVLPLHYEENGEERNHVPVGSRFDVTAFVRDLARTVIGDWLPEYGNTRDVVLAFAELDPAKSKAETRIRIAALLDSILAVNGRMRLSALDWGAIACGGKHFFAAVREVDRSLPRFVTVNEDATISLSRAAGNPGKDGRFGAEAGWDIPEGHPILGAS